MWEITVKGVVQGVGFRPTVKRCALEAGAKGSVKNEGAHVTILTDEDPQQFIKRLKKMLGPLARIESYRTRKASWEEYGYHRGGPEGFEILESSSGDLDSSLPPDTAVCDECLEEMFDPGNRRHLHPFTNCTNCGARYSLIEGLPYDRERTAMSDFPPCGICRSEYSDPLRRRFHAQTLSCPDDGPLYRFLDSDLDVISSGYRAIEDLASMIVNGGWGIVKGWGGMHIACGTGYIRKMREWYGRPYKPFALMCRGVDVAIEIVEMDGEMERSLRSGARPILLLDKKRNVKEGVRSIQENASPGLPTVGIFLPYSGVQHLLFRAMERAGDRSGILVMTSANRPNEPMSLGIEKASDLKAPGYLVHDRRISARTDDSVVVPSRWRGDHIIRSPGPFGVEGVPIRKARGLIPDPLPCDHKKNLIALGAERNVTVSLSRSGRIFTSPYLGNARNPDVQDYVLKTVDRLGKLFGGTPPEAVVVDRHPRYATRPIGEELGDKYGVDVLEVQHHHAHAASLIGDAILDRIACLAFDGVGFGDDGTPWGGECIISDTGSYERVDHLEPFGLPGGDASVYHPERIAYWLSEESGFVLDIGDEKTSALLRKTHRSSIMTTSMGRLMDALSALMLGVTWRSYDGEPAMRLERLLGISRSPDTDLFRSASGSGPVPVRARWKILMDELFGKDPDPGIDPDIAIRRKADLTMGFLESLVEDMVDSALRALEDLDDGKMDPMIGLSGGVAYNTAITGSFVNICRKNGARAVLHSRVPPGDGGVSVGQAIIGGHMIRSV